MSRAATNPSLSFSEADDLDDILERASRVRDRVWGKVITYSRKVFIPLTNLCRDTCGYCTYAQSPSSPTARTLTPDEVMNIAERGRAIGCKEALFSLGEKPELVYREAREALARFGHTRTIDYVAEMCGRVARETGILPHANVGTMTEDEVRLLKPVTASMGMMLESVSGRLTARGQTHYACPDKVPEVRLQTLRNAGRLRVPFTTGILIGIGETWDERVKSLEAIRDVHREYGHIQEVIIQNFRAKPDIRMAGWPEPSAEEMIRTIAVARLILDDDISVQAPPNLQDDFAAYVSAGLNDWGGVSPLTPDHINPERAWPQIEELRDQTESAGMALRERLTVYPKYIARAAEFLALEMQPRVAALARSDGLAMDQRIR